jgi:hypothetical protein
MTDFGIAIFRPGACHALSSLSDLLIADRRSPRQNKRFSDFPEWKAAPTTIFFDYATEELILDAYQLLVAQAQSYPAMSWRVS